MHDLGVLTLVYPHGGSCFMYTQSALDNQEQWWTLAHHVPTKRHSPLNTVKHLNSFRQKSCLAMMVVSARVFLEFCLMSSIALPSQAVSVASCGWDCVFHKMFSICNHSIWCIGMYWTPDKTCKRSARIIYPNHSYACWRRVAHAIGELGSFIWSFLRRSTRALTIKTFAIKGMFDN